MVDVSNPFDLLNDDGGAPQKKVEPQEDKSAKPADKQKVQQQARPLDARPIDATNKRGGFRGGRGGRGRGRGRGNGRPEGTGNRMPKRLYDRHSGTGRGTEIRKGGYGGYGAAGTWKDEVTGETEAKAEQPADASAPTDAPAAAEVAAPPKEETPEEKKEREEYEAEAKKRLEEEEADRKKKTYDQFLEEQKAKAVADDANLKLRVVEVDESQFKACQPVSKKVDTYLEVDDDAKDDKKKGKSKEKSAKKALSLDEFKVQTGGIEVPYTESFRPRGRGGRGGRGSRGGAPRGDRGAPRGGFRGAPRGRGGYRGGRGGHADAVDPNLNITNETDFPKLGGVSK